MFWTLSIMKRGKMKELDVIRTWKGRLRISFYFTIVFSIFSAVLISGRFDIAFLSAGIVLFIETVIENRTPLLKAKIRKTLRIISVVMISISLITWEFITLQPDFLLASIIAWITASLLLTLIVNPFSNKKWGRPTYWFMMSFEFGLLFDKLGGGANPLFSPIFTGLAVFFYPIIFEYDRVLDLISYILDNITTFFVKIAEKIVTFFKSIGSLIKKIVGVIVKFFMGIKEFYQKNRVIFLIPAAIISDILGIIVLMGIFPTFEQAFSVSSLLSSTIWLFRVFYRKEQRSEKEFIYRFSYWLIIYILLNTVIYSFYPAEPVWVFYSITLFCAPSLAFIYVFEKKYNLSIKWRFYFTIFAIISGIASVVAIFVYVQN